MRRFLAVLLVALVAGQVLPFVCGGGGSVGEAQGLDIRSPEYGHLSRSFRAPFRVASLFRLASHMVVLLLVLRARVLRRLDAWMRGGAVRWGVLACFLLLLAGVVFLARFPYAVGAYVHGRSFGMVVASPGAWLVDQLKLSGVWALRLCVEFMLLYCVVGLSPGRWWLAGALLVFGLFHLAGDLMPGRPRDPVRVLTPLVEGAHYRALHDLIESEGIEMAFFVDDSSRRNDMVNAHLDGRDGHRFFVFTDTFIERFTPEESALAVAHELGHLKNQWRFLVLRSVLSLALLGGAFFMVARLRAQGRHAALEGVGVLPACMLALWVGGVLLAPLNSAVDRLDERLADRHALTRAGDPADYASLLVKGARYNLEELCPPRWFVFWFGGHPRLCDRLRMADEWQTGSTGS